MWRETCWKATISKTDEWQNEVKINLVGNGYKGGGEPWMNVLQASVKTAGSFITGNVQLALVLSLNNSGYLPKASGLLHSHSDYGSMVNTTAKCRLIKQTKPEAHTNPNFGSAFFLHQLRHDSIPEEQSAISSKQT
jgi:hypothetical protein